MSGAPDPFSSSFSADFGGGSVDGWFSMPVTALTTIKVIGLLPTAYAFRVYAINAEGAGPPSPVLTVEA